jgi:FlaA1/EpsC-like NDP-sugar epimerase
MVGTMNKLSESPAAIRGDRRVAHPISFSAPAQKNLLYRPMLIDIIAGYDIVAMFCSALLSRFLYLSIYKGSPTPLLDYVSVILIAATSFHFFARQNGLYDTEMLPHFSSQLSSLIYVCLATFATAFVVLFFLKISDRFSRVWFLEWSAFFLIFLGIGRGLLARQLDRLSRRGGLRRSVALVGTGAQFDAVKELLTADDRQFCLTGIYDTAQTGDFDSPGRFVDKLRETEIEDIVVALPAAQAT